MKALNYRRIEQSNVDDSDAKGVKIRIAISEKDGADNFAMRVFEVEKDGFTPQHSHDWEHEVFVLSGKGVVVSEGKEQEVEKGHVVFIPPGEQHQFKNTGDEPLEFICLIPI